MLAGLRIDRLKKTPWFRPFLEGRRPAALRRFEERTGMDLARDVWEVVWSLSGQGSVAFLRGKFGGAFGQEPRFDAPGVVKRNYKTYYVLERDGFAVLFLGAGTAMMGPARELERIVDNRDQPGEQPPMALIRMVEELPICELWAVARGGNALRAASGEKLPLRAGPVFDALEELRLTARATGVLAVDAKAVFRTAEDARAVRDGLEALRQLAQIRPGEAAPAMAALQKARLEASGREVLLKGELGFDDWIRWMG
ncbi:MAG: hypothetical protein N2036_01425 [Bryobacteraceae bacterium]|nr:hypothetical protein [Bryobacteraceae bacterium]